MRIPSGVTDQVIYFVAVDATDLKTRETGLTSFTVYRSRNGGSATAMTTPTVAEVSASNMAGVYTLLLDEDMTIDAGDDSQEMVFHITASGMAPVTRTIELYRPKITAGETMTVASGAGVANVTQIGGDTQSATDLKDFADAGYDPATNKVQGVVLVDTLTTYTGNTPQTGDSFARLGAPAGVSVSADIATRLAAASYTAPPAAATNAAAVRTELGTELGRIDAAISSRLASASYTAPDNATIGTTATAVSAVKTQTDKMVFTVTGQIDANAESMNGAEILGNGTSGDLWRGE